MERDTKGSRKGGQETERNGGRGTKRRDSDIRRESERLRETETESKTQRERDGGERGGRRETKREKSIIGLTNG